MEFVAELAKAAIKQGARRWAVPYVGTAFTLYGLIKAGVSNLEQQNLETVVSTTKCNCFSVVTIDWAPSIIRCVEKVAAMRHGCAFVFNGTAIYHHQTDLDVKAVATIVLRWDPRTRRVERDTRSTHGVNSCRNCSGH